MVIYYKQKLCSGQTAKSSAYYAAKNALCEYTSKIERNEKGIIDIYKQIRQVKFSSTLRKSVNDQNSLILSQLSDLSKYQCSTIQADTLRLK